MQTPKQQTISGILKEVTVFFTGAELNHTATVNLSAGENEVVIEGLSSQIDINSLKIKTTGEVVVSSFEFTVDYLSSSKEVPAHVNTLLESLDTYKKEMQQLDIDIRINATLTNQLQEGIRKSISGSENGLGIDDLIKTMDYLKTKLYELEQTHATLTGRKNDLQETISRLENQLQHETTNKNKTSGVLRLKILSAKEESCDLLISYFTQAAGWTPSYDIHVKDTDAPVEIRLRANVKQTSGLDWEQVKPTLSNGRPGNGKIAPLFSPWFLRPQGMPKSRNRNTLAQQNVFSYGREKRMSKEYILEERMEEMEMAMSPTIEEYVETTENTLDIHYAIHLPYSVPGNGKPQYIDLQTYEVKAAYKYYTTPKLDKQTYLLAEITEWEKLGLLSGTANVNFNGTYLGESYLDTSSVNEKQTLTLGTDPRIIVKREKIQDYSSNRLIGSDLVHQFSYRITVKNNRNQPVHIVVKDQYPLSTDKSIEVTLLKKETTPWTANNQDIGVISWESDFQAGETKEYQIAYNVKYPKDTILNL